MKRVLAAAASGIIFVGCGDNLGGPGTDFTLEAPAVLRAVSLDSSHVRLSWTPSASATVANFGGYVVSWGTRGDTLSAATLSYIAGPLPAGATLFQIRSRRTTGAVSSPNSITWAPAYRFDASPLVVYELDVSRSGRANGVDAGTTTTNPVAFEITPQVEATLDFFLQGAANQPLRLRSANLYSSGWNVTLFSSVVTANATLDSALTAFPAEASFALQEIQVGNDSVYCARIHGNTGEQHYVRIHVRILPGVFPDRSVQLRLSLQRVPFVPFAAYEGGHRLLPLAATVPWR
ncbi:MAG: hypothetical protein AB1428_00345 [Bacteroidota bacterium]